MSSRKGSIGSSNLIRLGGDRSNYFLDYCVAILIWLFL